MAYAKENTIYKYSLEDRIGGGNFGEVWTATDLALKTKVAVKLLDKSQYSIDDRLLEAQIFCLLFSAICDCHKHIAQHKIVIGFQRKEKHIMSLNDRELLARMIMCEAGGEGENGMRAVATVIMNRVNVSGGEYLRTGQGSLRRILYQPYQFDCAWTELYGRTNMQNIYNMSPEPIHFEIADWALGGGLLNAAGNCLWYFNPYAPCISTFPRNGSGTFHTAVNAHCFYRPTSAYANT